MAQSTPPATAPAPASVAPSGAAAVPANRSAGLSVGGKNFDHQRPEKTDRVRAEALLQGRDERRGAAERLTERVRAAHVEFDAALGSPKFISATGSFLTGSGGEGGAVPAARMRDFPEQDLHRVVKGFLAEYAALFGHGPALLAGARVVRDYETAHNGLRTTVWQQELDGVRIFESTLQSNVTQRGELVNVSSRLVPDARGAAEAGTPNYAAMLVTPPIDAKQAVSTAAGTLGESVPREGIVENGPVEGPAMKQHFRSAQLLDVGAEMVWLPQDESALRLCWEVVFMSKARGEMFRTLVDAETGAALVRQGLTEYLSAASYRVFTGDSPTPMSPGLATPGTTQPAEVARTLVTLDAFDTTASPNGWIDDGVNETRGNNVDAHLDVNADNVADTPRPQGSPSRVFDFALDLTQAPSAYRDAAVTNLFYWNNYIHDRYYQLGFTEAAGNFQNNTFGRGGAGNDAVQADAQDGSGTNNANFSTPADGSAGRMQMYVFTGPTPDRDGDFDQEVVIHEYTHGLSNRLVGGGVGISALQPRGMGEGWSDFYALCLLSQPGDDANGTYAAGAYASYQLSGLTQNYYYGIRRYPYCTDLLKNPLTFKDIDPAQASGHSGVPKSPIAGSAADEVHNQGEVWCVTLWEARANLIAKLGAAAGNDLILRLVTDGMKLAPANPNFLQARDAILQAELVDTGGANRNELWAAFAKRGMGAGATSPASSATAGLVENYDLPDALAVTPSAVASASGPIGGPFTPATYTFTLYNGGPLPLPWVAAASAGWLSFSQTSGTLATGGTVQIQATVNAGATTLPAGAYRATVTFTNTNSAIVQTRTVPLNVDYLYVPLFADDFESGALDPAYWVSTGAGPYRTQVTTANVPHAGNRQLTMDSSTDGTYARNEATLTLNLTGRSNLVLRFWAKMFSDEPNGPPASPFTGGADFDGIAISADGTNWYEVQPLRSLTADWQQLTVDLDAAAAAHGLAYGPTFRIRFNHYDNYGIPTDGFAFDDVLVAEAVNRRLQITAPTVATEGGPSFSGTVTVTPVPSAPLVVNLASSDPDEATVTATVTILAGASSATFTIATPDDALLDGTQTVTLTASSASYVNGTATIAVQDNETAVLALDVPAAGAEGGGALTGTVSVSTPPDKAVRVALSSADASKLLLPASVDIPAGQMSAPFVITVVDDARIDGTVNVTITAHVANWTDASATIAIADNESTALSVTLPSDLREGDAVRAGSVSIGGTLHTDLTIALASSDSAGATVPPSVTIFAGQTSATLALTVVDNALLDGAHPVTVTASAAGFTDGSKTAQIADNDVHHFDLSAIPATQIRNGSTPLSVTARDINGAVIANYAGTVAFSATGEGGAVPCTPAGSGAFTGGVWSSAVSFGAYATAATLTVSDALGHSTTSNSFAITRGPLHHFGWPALATQRTTDTPFPVTVTAQDSGGNTIDEFTGAVSLAALTPAARAPTGTGASSVSDGLQSGYRQGRLQCIYTPAEVGAAGSLAALELNLTTLPPDTYNNFTIRLKHTARTNYTTDSSWEGGTWTTVYQATQTFTSTGWVKFPFAVPFDFDGTSNVMVDISYNNPTAPFSYGGTYQATGGTPYRTLFYQTFGNFGDPLGWSGYAVPHYPNPYLPNLRFSSYSQLSPIRPAAAGAFSAGVWSGSVSVPFSTPSVKLKADDGAGHSGTSGEFAVRNAPLPPGIGSLYSENFETVPLSSAWKFSGTQYYRTQVVTTSAPHSGARHLTMDATTYSGYYSRNEATWTVDLAGQSGLTLKFWAKGFTESPNGPPPSPFVNGADFDGVAVSADGTYWYEVQGLRSLTNSWVQYTVNLDNAIKSLGIGYNSAFKIRFNQYDRDSIPYRGIAIDDIDLSSVASPYAVRIVAPAQVTEGGVPQSATVTLPVTALADTVVTLTNGAPAKISMPAQVTISAGSASASFYIQPLDDAVADGNKTVGITASAPYFPSSGTTLLVVDNDLPGFTLSVPTTSTVEGAGAIQATLTLGAPAAAPITFNVATTDATAISVPTTVTAPVGATSVILPLTVVDDRKVDGTQTATVTVSAAGLASQSVTITVADNETLNLLLDSNATPALTSVTEGAGAFNLYAYLPGTVTTATTVTFASSAPLKITPPAAATIAAGSSYAYVAFTALNDNLADGPQTVTLTASAPGFNSATYTLTFLDNDPHHFTITPIASPQVRGAAIPVTVTACDPGGTALAGFSGPATLSGAAGGSTVAVTPGALAGFVSGVWTGSVRVNDFASAVTLTVNDGAGHAGVSNAFDTTTGPFALLAWDPVGLTQTPGNNVPVTVRATDAGGNVSASVNEPITVRALAPAPGATVGSGSSTTSNFLYTYSSRGRSESLYLASELGGPAQLGGMAVYVNSISLAQGLSNLTIRIKTTTRTALSSTTGWDGDGWTVVHQSNPTLSSKGWVTFLFDTPFDYAGLTNLLVDVSFKNAATNYSDTSWRADYGSTTRMLYGSSSDTTTDPLLWSGTNQSGYASSYLAQMRFFTLQPITASTPPAPAVNAGVWSGGVAFGGNLERVFLDAVDTQGRHGTSNGFRVAAPASLASGLPFFDGFETGALANAWTVSGWSASRVAVSSANAPHTGSGHVVLDSSSSNYAREQLTAGFDLAGCSVVTLDFWAKRFGGTDDYPAAEPFTDSASFDGVAISADGTNWYEVQALRGMTAGQWTHYSVNLDSASASRGLAYNSNFRIRFSQYTYASVPSDGIAIDDVSVNSTTNNRVQVGVPASIAETSVGATGTVSIASAAASDTVVALSSSSPQFLAVPASVTIPAGQTSGNFSLTPAANPAVTGPFTVAIGATAPGLTGTFANVQVLDNETGSLTLSIPSPAAESAGTVQATLTISPPSAGTLTAALTSSLPATAQVPAAITILGGQSSTTFPVTIVSDSKLTGPQTASIAAAIPGWATASAPLVVNDDEPTTLTIYAASVTEGSFATLYVYAGGSVVSDTVVALSSSDPLRLTVPATVTIPSGSSSGSFVMTAVENNVADGTQQVTVTASAPGLTDGSAAMSVYDNELHHFAFSTIPAAQVRGQPFTVTITAQSLSNTTVSTFTGTVNLAGTGDAGAIAVTPSVSAAFSSGKWTGSVTANTFSNNIVLTATDGAGHAGASGAFNAGTGAMHHYLWSSIPSTQTAGQPFTSTITAYDAGGNPVTAANGYVLVSSAPGERIIGSGTSTTSTLPLYTFYHDERSQVVYLASEVGGAATLSTLALYVTTLPGQTLNNWTLRMKHTALSSQSSWDSTGWTTVYQSAQTISQTGWVTFNFTTPFAYNGTGNLLVDFSFNNSSYTSAGSVRSFAGASGRSLYYYTDSGYGDPLTWSGTSPFPTATSTVPQIKLNAGATGVAAGPGAVLLTNGSWTGSTWVAAPTAGTSLTATDFNGLTGASNSFAVLAALDSDGDGLPDAWESANGLAPGNAIGNQGALGDPDRDGIPNLLEYAFNLNPNGASLAGLPDTQVKVNPADGWSYVEFTYRRRIGSVGLTYTIQTSVKCSAWSANSANYQQVGLPVPVGDGVAEMVTVRLLPAIGTPGVPARFARLRVSSP